MTQSHTRQPDASETRRARPSGTSVQITAIVSGAFLLFGYFIWPGQWHFSELETVPMRTHRITGRSELFAAGRWVDFSPLEDAASSEDRRVTVMYDPTRHDVQGRGGVGSSGYFESSMYNGTPCHLERAVFLIATVTAADTNRRAFSQNVNIPSRQSSPVSFRVDGADQSRRFESWGIDSLAFRCPEGVNPDRDLFGDIVNRPAAP